MTIRDWANYLHNKKRRQEKMKRIWERIKSLFLKGWKNFIARNLWGVAYLIIANVFTSIMWRILPHTADALRLVISAVFVLAILLQISEYLYEIKRPGKKVTDVYGTQAHYIQDTIGDVFLAYVGFFIALI